MAHGPFIQTVFHNDSLTVESPPTQPMQAQNQHQNQENPASRAISLAVPTGAGV